MKMRLKLVQLGWITLSWLMLGIKYLLLIALWIVMFLGPVFAIMALTAQGWKP